MNLPNDNCQKCRLFEGCLSPYMSPSGAHEPTVLVVGEAPGEQEDMQGIPFVGRSGQLLRRTLEEFFDIERDVMFTNTIRCRPPDNRISKRAINYCKPNLLQEIEEYDPDLVLLMGNSPLHAVLGETGITTWNGVVVERDGRIYVPLFHPAYILRNRDVMDDWLNGLLSAEEALNEGSSRGDSEYEYIYPESTAELLEMEAALSFCEWIAFDTETSSLDPYGEDTIIMAVSFATSELAYGVTLGHPGVHIDPKDLEEMTALISNILQSHDSKVIGHNIKFDQVQWKAWSGDWFDAGGDTMLISHLLDSRRGIHGLKRLAGLHLGMYDYDKGIKDYYQEHPKANPYKGGSYAAIPLDILLPYAAMDASSTYMLHEKLYPQLSKEQKTLYGQLVMPASNALARVQNNGIAIDQFIADRYMRIYKMRQREVYEDIMEDKKVIDLVEDRQAMLDEEREGKKRKGVRKLFQFNPNSYPQLRSLYYDYYDMPILGTTEMGKPTTKSDILRKLKDRFPIVETIRYYKLLNKMIGTYLGPAATGAWASADGRVRCNFNLHGTRTGRLSSSEPNLQNIPTPEKEPGTLLETLPIKNIFTHTFPNGVLMSVDYASMELRVFSSLARCKPMIEAFTNDQDVHCYVTRMIYPEIVGDADDYTIKTKYKDKRYSAKWTNWTLLFGGGAHTLHSMYDIPMAEAEKTVKTYFQRFPEILDLQEDIVADVERLGYVASPLGRREHLPYINSEDHRRSAKARRASLNMPIQSAASDVLLLALTIIDRAIRKDGMKTMIVNTVHDSIVLDVPPGEISNIANLCVAVMEGIIDMAAFYAPGLDFSWLTCPLKVDVEIGTHYGAEEAYHTVMEE